MIAITMRFTVFTILIKMVAKMIMIGNEEHRLENLEPEPESGEPGLEILKAWAYFENDEPELKPKFWAPSL